MYEIILTLLMLGWFLYKLWTYPYSYWKNRGFPHLEASFPFGTDKHMALLNEYAGYYNKRIYDNMGDKEYVGIVIFRRPYLFLKGLDIIKSVLLKDFIHFTDRTNVDNINEPSSHHMFNLGGDKWKAIRTNLSPTFTSGKLKLMFPLLELCSKNLEEILQKMVNENNEIDIKDAIGRYTAKTIGTCAYGIDLQSLSDDNPFVLLGKSIFTNGFPPKRYWNMLFQNLIPGIQKVVKARTAPPFVEKFLTSIVLDNMSFREKSGFNRHDFIDLLMEIRDKKEISVDSITDVGTKQVVKITDSDLVAQVFIFLAAGYETSASVASFCLFELAENPDIQEKLRNEIKANQPITYQSLQEMKYMDMVFNETMRKYPTAPFLTRKCTKAYKMPDGTILEKGTSVIIPIFALHHDPEYFPEPNKFDPERFTQENKDRRTQFSFIPFGEGPRICIGMRFAHLQTKLAIATVLSKYKVEKTLNTISPMEFVASPVVSTIWHPITIRLKQL